MKKGSLKRIVLAAVLAGALAITPAIAGCQVKNGRDGVNGKDLTIYDIWQETIIQTGNPDLTFEEFLREYLSYNSEQLEESTSLRSSINRSLMSGVSIITTFDEYAYRGFGGSYTYTEVSYYGSGVIVDVNRQSGDMIVVTNCHVVYSADARMSNGTAISAANGFAKSVQLWLYGSEFQSGDAIEAQIVGASKSYDIAVLKVSGSSVVKNSQAIAAQWCSAEESFVGDLVYTVGNADGKKLAASVGYVSKDSEEITVNMGSESTAEPYTYHVLRTDTAINGGNSGGGLFNKYGELVGIVNAKTISEDIDNMGYALAGSTSKRVVKKLIEDADGNYGIEALNPGNISFTATDRYTTGLDENGIAHIKEVVTVTNAPAMNAKLHVGDIVKSVAVNRSGKAIDCEEIERMHNLTDVFLSVEAGDEVCFIVERDGQETEVVITFTAASFRRKT